MSKPPTLWTTEEVVAYLHKIDLGDLAPKAKEHDVHGEDLVALSETELKAELDITRLQARRIKRHLEDGGAGFGKDNSGDVLPALPDVTGIVPRAEAPDLLDREALAPTPGSFSRLPPPALGIPVAAGAPAVEEEIHIDETLVKQYGETVELIARLEGEQVMVRLPAAREVLAQLERRLQYEKKKYSELKAACDKKKGKAEELEDGKWYPGKFLLGKKRAEAKVETAQDEAAEFERKLQASGAVLEALHRQQAQASAEVNELTAQVDKLQKARQWEEGVLPHVFAGSAGNSQENALEKEVDALAPKLNTARQYQTSYGQAYELMKGARKQLQRSQELFRSAYGFANMNLVGGMMRPGRRDGPMGNMADIAKRVQSQQAAQLAHAACDAIMKARSVIPDMPHIKVDNVRALRGLNLVGALFDGVLIDIIARQKISQGMRVIDELVPESVAAERWLEGWLCRVQADLRTTEMEYSRKKAELNAVRRELMQEQVRKRALRMQATAPTAVLVATVGVAAGGPARPPPPDLL